LFRLFFNKEPRTKNEERAHPIQNPESKIHHSLPFFSSQVSSFRSPHLSPFHPCKTSANPEFKIQNPAFVSFPSALSFLPFRHSPFQISNSKFRIVGAAAQTAQ
jgi:hypothetical protein